MRAKILMVDDAEFAYRFLSALLEELPEPHQLDWRGSYEAGLDALTGPQPYDVCLLDYQLGAESGLDFLQEARKRSCRTPIVLLTGQGTRELELEAQRIGAADFLVKGDFSAQTFDRVIRYTIERAKTLERLRESEERYSLALEGANDGIWDWRVGHKEIHLSPRWKSLVGYQDEELPNDIETWWNLVHSEDLEKLKLELDNHVHGRTPALESEHRLRHKDGTFRHVLVRGRAVRNTTGDATRIAGSLTDVTQSRSHDPLTGLPNRVLLLDRLEQAFHRARRDPEYRFAVLFVDLDRFKIVNDSLGHSAGDALLIGIARRLEKCVRVVDTVARLGGDEFTALLDDAREPDGALRVARRILEELTQPFIINGHEVFAGASIGIALSSPHYTRPDEVLRDADTAMYRAKSGGKGRYVVFDQSMHERAVKVLSVESGLRRAIEDHELEVHYQPIFQVKTRKLVGMEALVRWRHADRGLVQPMEFVPIAEDSDLIGLLDMYVLRQACAQLQRWRAQHPRDDLFVAVNASGKQFHRVGFVEDVQQTLLETKLEPQALHLEITETVTMDPTPLVGGQLEKLANMGIKLVIDDFGVGYSSLSVLQRYSFHGLKVDRSFVSNIDVPPHGTELVRAIVAMAAALQLSCTAEGVETERQLQQLEVLGCQHMQGFLLAKPLPASAITDLVARLLPNQ